MSTQHGYVAAAAVIALSLTGCGRRSEPASAPPETAAAAPAKTGPDATSEQPAPVVELAELTAEPASLCATAGATASQQDLFMARHIGEVGDTTWIVAHRMTPPGGGWTALLAALGADGGLVTHDLGVQTVHSTSAVTVEGAGIRFLYFDGLGGTARWLKVDVRVPDRPRTAAPPAPVPGLAVRGWVHRFAADGTRAIVGMSLGNDDNHRVGDAVILLDVPTGRALRRWNERADQVFCRAACGFVTTDRDVAQLVWVEPGAETERRARIEAGRTCHVPRFRTDDAELLLLFGTTGFAGWAMPANGDVRRLASGRWRQPADACDHATDLGSAGLVDRRRLHQWQAGRLAASSPLPALGHDAQAQVVGGELVYLNVRKVGGMTHSPTDARGVRRYYRWSRFEGAAVERAALSDGSPRPTIELPFAGRESIGIAGNWSVVLLRRGARVSALLAGRGGSDRAELVPVLEPCPR